ncbi:MAG: class I SAM-dependent methyltransferase [Candidatus Accumulibacter sp.]|uniref:class I SAM-dependent methyltransferase n=1 Tax=Accumulibacter sp. TaxID=2053492 RepID=UPI001D29C0BD|nr:class I SAM-dependent methyltransferase [Accumulibacter sp.]MCB1943097.1 class I SAM-dependent methyltransferase [Accumulibacter sp.]MCP5247366.1 class I SAM-dependent methyltransferase [Accumulibacter sp.]
MDARLQRRIQRYGWDRAVDFYDQCWLSRLLPATRSVLERAAIAPGDRVLDVACGTGVLAIAAAARVGKNGSVTGIDLSAKMVEAAQTAARALGLDNCRFERGDAEALPDLGGEFDVGLCGLGLMYMPDPERALVVLAQQLVPGARVAVSVWGQRSRCAWADIFPIVDARVESEVCPLFFRTGAGDTLHHALDAAGLSGVTTERLSVTLRYVSADEACDAAFLGGPVALAYSHFDAATRAAVRAEYLQSVESYRRGEAYAIPGEFVVGYGVKPATGRKHSAVTSAERGSP